ncbi:MAG TPA: polyprenyl synthetase family protein [Acidimicrobiales bacterium]|nr:polyprenyl synthetase family protein [Acidimicrobiales bacterium]
MTVTSVPLTPPAVTAVAARVGARIADLLADEAARWAAIDPALAEPLASLDELLAAGGKRLRPAFCHWAFVGAGGHPDDPAVADACAAVELLHAFACIHDDVMDDSARRHGAPTLHVDYAGRHRREGWRGPADRFGASVAILIGDLAFVYADRCMDGAPAPAAAVWHELRTEVTLGQYLDLHGTARRAASPELARRICQYKSGRYTVERPLQLGAAMAAPDRAAALLGPLSAFGAPLGEAFQLRDDLLGVFGDPVVTGKPVGEDLREGKPTLLAALARAAATGSDAAFLERRLGAADLCPDEVAAMQGIFESTGARDTVEGTVDTLVDRALEAADLLPLEAGAVAALCDMARFVAGRDH